MNKKKIIKVIFVDFIGLFIGILNGFILPKFLSIESYSIIKTFVLYISYAGILHLGFSDGIYILLGGKKITEITKDKIKGYLLTLIYIISIVFIILIVFSVFIHKDDMFVMFILYSFPYQIILFATLLYRATGEFDSYIIIRICINCVNLLSILAVIFVSESPFIYIFIQIIGNIIISVIYLLRIFLCGVSFEKIKFKEVKYLIKTGFIIMIANTISTLFLTLDRWFIKYYFDINEFAYYSFSISMLNLFITLISSITIVFYPYLANSAKDSKIISNIKNYIIIITCFAPAGYYILEFIVYKFIDKYSASLEVLGILILSIPFLTLINVICSNLYKVLNLGKIYLMAIIKMLIVSIILNFIALYIFKTPFSIACGTLISLMIFYFYSTSHFDSLSINKKEIVYFTIYITIYCFLNHININSFFKSSLFILLMLLATLIVYRKNSLDLLRLFLVKLKNSEKTE